MRQSSSRPTKRSHKPVAKPIARSKLYLAMLAASQAMVTGQAYAGPEGGQVVGGVGSIDQAGRNTTITQQTDRLAIDWQSFDVDADERVEFIQPDSSSIALNRILSHKGSEIHGQIDANGQVFLINPAGDFTSHQKASGFQPLRARPKPSVAALCFLPRATAIAGETRLAA